MSSVMMGKGASKEDKELASSIMAGEMKNAWEVEDRPNQVDQRPPTMRQQHITHKSPGWYDNYDRIFGRNQDGVEKEEGRGSQGDTVSCKGQDSPSCT